MNCKRFYPVIHCIGLSKGGEGHAMANVRIAQDNGADGVFLIGHRVRYAELCQIYGQVRKQFPDLWIGINFLDIGASRNWIDLFFATRSCVGLNGLWIDRLPDARLDLPGIQVFGGVAFKYDEPHLSGSPLAAACGKAVRAVDVATTSGNKTGEPPSVEKLATIHKLLIANRPFDGSPLPLAVASGVNASNVIPMLRYVDIFLVASSLIERDKDRGGQEYLVPERVRELAEMIHG